MFESLLFIPAICIEFQVNFLLPLSLKTRCCTHAMTAPPTSRAAAGPLSTWSQLLAQWCLSLILLLHHLQVTKRTSSRNKLFFFNNLRHSMTFSKIKKILFGQHCCNMLFDRKLIAFDLVCSILLTLHRPDKP